MSEILISNIHPHISVVGAQRTRASGAHLPQPRRRGATSAPRALGSAARRRARVGLRRMQPTIRRRSRQPGSSPLRSHSARALRLRVAASRQSTPQTASVSRVPASGEFAPLPVLRRGATLHRQPPLEPQPDKRALLLAAGHLVRVIHAQPTPQVFPSRRPSPPLARFGIGASRRRVMLPWDCC
jgi:hypothetical protein